MKQHSLSKEDILTEKKKFDELFSHGRFLHSKLINIIYKKSESFKIAFAVSGKIRKKVTRNIIKRHLREIYRTNKNEFPKNMHIILMVKKERYNFHKLKEEILSTVKDLE